MVEAYRGAGGAGPLALQVHLSWAPTEAEAEELAHDQWRSNVFGEPVAWDLETGGGVRHRVRARDAWSRSARSSTSRRTWRGTVTGSPSTPRLGFDEIYLHHVGQSQERFIDSFGEHVLPALKEV